MSRSRSHKAGRFPSRADGLRYEKGDRVFVRSSRGPLLPGIIIGDYVDWNLYRVVYMVDVAGQSPRAVEEWRLYPRSEGEGAQL